MDAKRIVYAMNRTDAAPADIGGRGEGYAKHTEDSMSETKSFPALAQIIEVAEHPRWPTTVSSPKEAIAQTRAELQKAEELLAAAQEHGKQFHVAQRLHSAIAACLPPQGGDVPQGAVKMSACDERQCQWVDRKPLYIKRLGNFVIDPSEYENEKGAFFRYEETPCRLIADPGKKFCPKHELIELAQRPTITATR